MTVLYRLIAQCAMSLCLAVIIPHTTHGQYYEQLPPPWRVGLVGGYAWEQHQANFWAFPGLTTRAFTNTGDSTRFPFGTGSAISIGAMFELTLSCSL
jgi:hypothetical protein